MILQSFRPMLACPVEKWDNEGNKLHGKENLLFPLFATPKIDGIRAISQFNQIVSRKLLPIPNRYVQACLKGVAPGLDGELYIPGKTFHEIQSAIMSEDGDPDFRFLVFDKVDSGYYVDRVKEAEKAIEGLQRCNILSPIFIGNIQQLETYEEQCIKSGYEGVCLRAGNSPYKYGRSTFKEHFLLKLKTFEDAEAVIVGFEELYQNCNEAIVDELGHTKHSNHQVNLIPRDKLGSLVVSSKWGEFKIGSGFTDLQRYNIWSNKNYWLDKTITFKYQPFGTKDKPRCPIFKGLRYD